MVYPPISTQSTSRSSLEQSTQSTLCQSPVPSLLLPHHQHHHHHQQQQQQQQQILYTPYNTISTCIPSTNQPQCIYPNTRRNPTTTVTLRDQDTSRGVKNTKWKSRPLRVKEHQPNANLQHSLSYAPPPPPPPPPPPLVLFDPIQSHLSTASTTPITPIYLNQSPTLFNHSGVYSNDNYTNYNPNVVTQPYYKPPEVQTYCLIDRPLSHNTYAHQQIIPQTSTYYNATSNTNFNHQNVKSFVASNVYSSGVNNDNRIIPGAVGPTQIFSNSLMSHDMNLAHYPNDKLMTNTSTAITNDLTMINCPEKIFTDSDEKLISDTDRLFTVNINVDNEKLSDINCDDIGIVKRHYDERFSDESSNFDFTIEAEKMVSALCNTTSCDLDKEDDELNRGEVNIFQTKLLSPDCNENVDNLDKADKSREIVDKTFKPWYFNDFSSKIKLSGESIGTQTSDGFIDKSQYPELIRRTIYCGCNEADKIIKSSTTISPKQSWLQNLSSATKIALTKSSTCFPIFSGDKVFSQDLISALLRVGNGWLILDHYLNKQHRPNLNDKYDNELIESFKKWEVSTNNLLQNVIKTFIKLETTDFSNDENISSKSTIINSSFPGDISLYVNYGLFGDPSAITLPLSSTPQSIINDSKSATAFARKCPYTNNENRMQKNRWSTGKESKLRTKWTITEHSRGSSDVKKKNRDEKSNWNLFPKDFTINPIPQLINTTVTQQKLRCNFFTQENDEKLNSSKQSTNIDSTLNAETIPLVENRPFWNPCVASSPLYNFPYNDTALNNLSDKMALLSQIETKRSDSNDSNTINLSAWFASMRNKRISNTENNSSTWLTSTPSTAPIKFPESRSIGSSSRMDSNRQLRTLKNMRTIQCAPWTANHLMDDRQHSKSTPDEYDSSEDVRVYMKPGSYNVPKKKNQSRRSQKRDASTLRNNRQNSQNLSSNDETSCPSNSLIISRSNISSSSSSTCSQDIQNKNTAWKAACASAGILLDALKAKEDSQSVQDIDKIVNSTPKHSDNSIGHWKTFEDNENKKHKMSFEVAEDESKALKLSSVNSNVFPRDDNQKSNIRTDSWLIRTLNNVTNETNMDCERPHNKRDNSSWKQLSHDGKKPEEHSFSLETSHTIAVMTLVDVAGKATYSETVRRFSSTTKPASCSATKMKQQKNGEFGKKDNNNSLCTIDETKNDEHEEYAMKQDCIKVKSDKMIKLKKNKNSNDDRDWSVWYSSKKKQHNNSLGQVALGKLVSIHRSLWRMDVTRILKCPATNIKVTETDNISSAAAVDSINMEHYRKIVKSPIFLETIGYKLKNHEYRKVEHVIRDFRRIIHNSNLYHKDDQDCIEKIENLSKKFEEFVQQNFPDELLSPNRFSMSNNNGIINSSLTTATINCNGEKEVALTRRRSTRTS